MQDSCQELNQGNAAEITQSLLFPIFHSSVSLIILSFSPFPLVEHKGPPLLPRPLQVPRPAAPAYCTSAFFKALLTQPPLNLTSQTPLTPLHQPLRCERKRRGLSGWKQRLCSNCVTKRFAPGRLLPLRAPLPLNIPVC